MHVGWRISVFYQRGCSLKLLPLVTKVRCECWVILASFSRAVVSYDG